jgi:membrane protein
VTVNRFDLRTVVRQFWDSFAGRCLGALLRAQVLDRAMALSAQAFTALIPLLILIGSFAPAGREDVVPAALIRRFRLTADAAAAVRAVFSTPGGASVGVLSVVLLVVSGVSFTRRLQRTYVEAWGLPRTRGVRNSVNALLGLTALLADVVLLFLARTLTAALPSGWLLGAPLSAAAALLLWTSVPWLLLDRRIRWQRLLPTGVLTTVGTAGYSAATVVYMPDLVASYSARYGLFGVTLALVGWLLSIALIVCGAAVVAVEFDRAPERWARRLRNGLGTTAGPGGQPDPGLTAPDAGAGQQRSGSRAAR